MQDPGGEETKPGLERHSSKLYTGKIKAKQL